MGFDGDFEIVCFKLYFMSSLLSYKFDQVLNFFNFHYSNDLNFNRPMLNRLLPR